MSGSLDIGGQIDIILLFSTWEIDFIILIIDPIMHALKVEIYVVFICPSLKLWPTFFGL